MSINYIEELIESAQNNNNPYYIRKGWIISARSKIIKAIATLEILEKEMFKDIKEPKEKE